jgi:hypothetical protein
MGNQAPGSEQRPKTPEGSKSSGSQDSNRSGQMEQSGKQGQPGGSQTKDRPHDSNAGSNKERNKG